MANTRVFDCQFLGLASRRALVPLFSVFEPSLEAVLPRVSPAVLPPAPFLSCALSRFDHDLESRRQLLLEELPVEFTRSVLAEKLFWGHNL